MESIFQDKYRKSSNTGARFFTFAKVGDRFEGTFVRRHNVTGDRFRGDCFNYEFMDDEGGYVMINGGKGGGGAIDKEMMNVKPGMIVGIELTELRDTGKVNPAKIYALYYNEGVVNNEWLEGNKGQIAFEQKHAEPNPIDAGDMKKIFDLAKTKLGATDAEDAKAKIIAKTGLAFIPTNLEKIIEQLETLK